MITIEDFSKIELVVGTIIRVCAHPNADKLMVLEVDVGEATRQLVAGLKGHYEADDLVGRQIVVVANLQPADLRGMESQGMLLAAQDGDRVVILQPAEKVTPGSRIL